MEAANYTALSVPGASARSLPRESPGLRSCSAGRRHHGTHCSALAGIGRGRCVEKLRHLTSILKFAECCRNSSGRYGCGTLVSFSRLQQTALNYGRSIT